MPRTYKRKAARASYFDADLQRAIKDVKQGVPLQPTAKAYGTSARTLRRLRDNKVANFGSVVLDRFRPDIGKACKTELVLKIQTMEKALLGLKTKDFCRLAYDLASQMGMKHRFTTENKMTGKDWLTGFMSRHPKLAICKP